MEKVEIKKKNILIGILSFAGILLVGAFIYYIDDKVLDTNDKNVESRIGIYLNEDGDVVEIINNNGNVSKDFQLKFNGKIINIEQQEDLNNDIFIVGDNHNLFLLNISEKRIVYQVKSSDIVGYEFHNKDEGNIEIYSYDEELSCKITNLLMVYSLNNGKVIKFDGNINLYTIKNNSLVAVNNNSILEYDLRSGLLINSEKYDYVNEDLIIDKNNIYYMNELSDYRNKEMVKKLKEYDDGKIKVIIFENGDDEYLSYIRKDNAKCMSLGNNSVRIYNIEQEDENYISYYTDSGMCHTKILVNKNNNKVFDFDSNSGTFKKVKDGYYIFKNICAMEGGYSFVYTEDMIELGKAFNNYDSIDNDENVYVTKDGYVIKYDVKGNELLKSKKYDYVNNGIIIDNVLYFIAKEGNSLYLINLNTNQKFEMEKNYSDDVNYDYDVRYENHKITIVDGFNGDISYVFDIK